MTIKSLPMLIAAALLLGACAPHHAKPAPADARIVRNAKNKPVGTTALCDAPGTTCVGPQTP